eukprot:COSAG01_NODE_73450_length_245_cov_2.342466_1_plen_51_part_10
MYTCTYVRLVLHLIVRCMRQPSSIAHACDLRILPAVLGTDLAWGSENRAAK